MANSFAYASIEKTNKNDDGTLTVYGKATDDSLDIDQQICDSDWLKRAMPEWMVAGGNVREQHSSIAAGVATEYEEKTDGHYITALVVDPVSVKKVETGVLKGFSIGIKGPRVIRDTKAAGGRIVDGQIVEISLVDRPANPNAKLILAKSVNGDLVKYDPDQERDENGRFGSGGGSSAGPTDDERRIGMERASEHLDEVQSAIGELRSANAEDATEGMGKAFPNAINAVEGHVRDAISALKDGDARASATHVELADKKLGDMEIALNRMFNPEDRDFGLANTQYSAISSARDSIKDYFATFGASKSSIPTPKDVAAMVNKNVEPAEETVEEVVTEEVAEETVELTEAEQVEKAAQLLNLTKSFTAELVKFDKDTFDRAKRELANLIIVEAGEMAEKGHDERNSLTELLESVKHLFAWYEGEMNEGEVSGMEIQEITLAAEADETADEEMCEKCGETMKMCKCADKVTTPGDEDADEEDSTEKSLVIDDATTVAIIEKAVTQAKESVKEEIGLLKSALEAAQVEASQLADELATAKTAVAGGGPKRAITKAADISVDTLLQKAAEYSVKASTATDPVLAQGYRELAADLTTKASRKDVNTNG
jgi:hypothetical protein